MARARSIAAAKAIPSAEAPRLELPDGARAEIVGDAIELRDGAGRLLVRYSDGNAAIYAPEGDLTLAAPHGRVRLSAALDVEIDAARDLVQSARRDTRIAAGRSLACAVGPDEHEQLRISADEARLDVPNVRLSATTTEIASARVRVVAQQLEHIAKRLAQSVDQYELIADRFVEKTRLSMREVADLLQTRVGRARTVVRTTFALFAGRTTIRSKEDTSIDGRKILLG